MRLNFFCHFQKSKQKKNYEKPTFPMLTGALSLFLSLTDIVSD